MSNQTPVFLNACQGKPTPHTPIWLMRQAGRYMKEYRDVRSKVDFLDLCKSPDLVTEVTLTAVDVLGVDAAIIFADILLIGESFGFELDFKKGEGPRFANPFRERKDLNRLREPHVRNTLGYVGKAIRQTRDGLDPSKALIGFAGAPFTVAAYTIEGGGSKNFEHTKKLIKSDPAVWNEYATELTDATIEYLAMQIEAGADCYQLFDSWAGTLSIDEYELAAFPHAKRIFEELKERFPGTPGIYFGVNTYHLLRSFEGIPCSVMGIDYKTSLKKIQDEFSFKVLQGNLDPITLLSSKEVIERETKKILDDIKGHPHIFNLGHGILPNTPVDHAKYLIDLVHEQSAK